MNYSTKLYRCKKSEAPKQETSVMNILWKWDEMTTNSISSQLNVFRLLQNQPNKENVLFFVKKKKGTFHHIFQDKCTLRKSLDVISVFTFQRNTKTQQTNLLP